MLRALITMRNLHPILDNPKRATRSPNTGVFMTLERATPQPVIGSHRKPTLAIEGGSKWSEVFCDVSITPITDIVWKKKNRKVLRW
ncbi:hypothetical protein CEK26_013043 [Fusarium fujikuroi]|uniref:Uncharacterized protein n=1 Tax=Fusarium fujikuroi TaxID=5127 RepID=A0A0I9XVC9_FUSFU|nr:Uncharacterized protein Y057_136 [Fusarium fujikuroi]KLO96587.1 Uncharacterized protein LW93_13689 [Fusarium fujikuroi]QGI69085.1 hypothetical protein CEK27_013056 [Fusarium fujikuroi]QGI99974.1 hypothetical protein CEK26_013043 [Fusarium fujikuroi]VTT78447.1 unnamed protein product [Fusarium fujikuroi]